MLIDDSGKGRKGSFECDNKQNYVMTVGHWHHIDDMIKHLKFLLPMQQMVNMLEYDEICCRWHFC